MVVAISLMTQTPFLAHLQAHPDRALLADAQNALEWWAQESPDRPTSSITGGGAVEAVERALVRVLGGNLHALALPNATFGLRVALRAIGVALEQVRPGAVRVASLTP